MHDLPLSALRALAAVYETGGIRPAGRRLQVAHSAISRHLKELEHQLGVSLFEAGRGHGSLVFTAQGETLGQKALEALQALETSVASVREDRRGNSIVVATTPSFAVRWLLPRLPEFQDAHTSVEVSVIVDQQRNSPIEEGSDISIRMGKKPRSASTFPLMDDQLFPVASPKYLERYGSSDACLMAQPLLHDRDPNTSWALWQEQFGPKNIDVRKGPRFTSSDLVLRAAEQSLGVALARGRLVQDALDVGTLIRLFGDSEVVLNDAYWLILNDARANRLAVRAFIEWLKSSTEIAWKSDQPIHKYDDWQFCCEQLSFDWNAIVAFAANVCFPPLVTKSAYGPYLSFASCLKQQSCFPKADIDSG
jgi:LysR family glycine cleavage system transcriptional activator